MNFGKKLKDIRKSNDLSQQDMSEILFTTQGNYRIFETNIRKPSINQLKILTEHFNLDANFLLPNNEEQVVNFNDQSSCNIAALKAENYYSISSDKIADIENKLNLIISKL
ncbi:MAG: helix-turn-helix domain-containing protein [Ferruginibacter sp.]